MAKKIQLGYKDIEKRLQAIKPASSDADEIGYQLQLHLCNSKTSS